MAWKMLFTSDIGLFSLIGIVFIICMAIWFSRFYSRKMHEEEAEMRNNKRLS